MAIDGSPDAFYGAVLRNLGIQDDPARRGILKAWASLEGTAARNNPLATTLRAPGSIPLPGNSAGVQQYATPAAGAAATAATIRNGHYPTIIAGLRAASVNGTTTFSDADLRTWSGGGYDSARLKQAVTITTSVGGASRNQPGEQIAGAVASAASVSGIDLVGNLLGRFFDPGVWLRVLAAVGGTAAIGLAIVFALRSEIIPKGTK